MIKCIIHCSDIHIRNYQRLVEYSEVLSDFIARCKEIASAYDKEEVRIVIAGDLVHQKNTVSNELMFFTSNFIRELSGIAKVIIIAGNHDYLSSNENRLDTLSGLFATAQFENAEFLDSITEYKSGCIKDQNVIWALYSTYDGFIRPDIESAKDGDENCKVIGLFHGDLVGATLYNGYVMDSGVNASIFNGCDVVMAGHIHKRQVIEKGGVKIVYGGSLIQQNFGESVSNHGFVEWTIDDNNVISEKLHELESNYSMYNIEVNSLDEIDEDKERLINF